MDVLTIAFLNANTVRRSRHAFTIYEIEVRSSHSIPWVLYKRYTDFFNLHQQLVKAIQSDPKLVNIKIQLPTLPPKSYKAMQVEYVEWRQKKLEAYLQELVQIPELFGLKFVCEFINVPEEVRAMLQRRLKPTAHDNAGVTQDRPISAPIRQGLHPEEQQIMDLLKNLSLEQHKVKALDKFDSFFFDKRPKYSPEYIHIFFVGDEVYQGVIQACGTFSHSKVARCAALNLLAKVLNIERNKEALAFLDRFTKLDPRQFKEINLHRHILEPQTQLAAFQLSRIISEKLPHIPKAQYIPEAWAQHEFDRWLELQNQSVGKTVLDQPEQDNENLLEIQEGILFGEILTQKLEEIEPEFDNESEDWQFLNEDEESPVNVVYKQVGFNEIWKLKASFSLNVSAYKLYHHLVERGISFLTTKVAENVRVNQLDDVTCVLRTIFKKYRSPYKHRDVCSIVTGREFDDGTFRVVTMSVDDPNVPESKEMPRYIILPSGWKIVPTAENSCTCVFYAQLTNDSVLIVSPDLLGETDELQQSLLGMQGEIDGVSPDFKFYDEDV